MREELLQFIWSAGLFNQKDLSTSKGEGIIIYKRGVLNTIAGPDFSDARIRIGESEWAGNIEIHVKASEWNHHKHHLDKAYNNVILHVVFEHDFDVHNQAGDLVPTLVLSGRISKHMLSRYDQLKQAKGAIPCTDYFPDFPKIQFTSWLDRLLIERLERKAQTVELIFNQSKSDWLQTFYSCLMGYMGQNRNKLAFEELSRVVPFALLSKYLDNQNQVEALLFGASGLIPQDSDEAYVQKLNSDWNFLKDKHQLNEISTHWKFGGLRPEAFPTRRIHLFFTLVRSTQIFYNQLMQTDKMEWASISAEHTFWKHHYNFNSHTEKKLSSEISQGLKNLLIINAIAPFSFFYGKYTDSQEHIDYALTLLENCRAETNKYTKQWASLGYSATSASDSQSLIELTTQFCMHKKCVLCPVGKTLISKP